MIVAEVSERLRAMTPAVFMLVEGVAEIAALKTARPAALPAAYVFISQEAAGDNERITGVLQRVEMDLSVVLVTENLSDPREEAASNDVTALKGRVNSALLGWQPPSAEDVVTAVGGRLVRARDGLVWWEMLFGTAIYQEAS